MPGGDALAEAVGAAVPAELAALPEEHREQLARLVTTAVHDRSELIDHAIDDSLRYLPALIRGPVKRALGIR